MATEPLDEDTARLRLAGRVQKLLWNALGPGASGTPRNFHVTSLPLAASPSTVLKPSTEDALKQRGRGERD